MKNKYIKIGLLALSVLGISSSCGEDFLNIRPTEVVDSNTLKDKIDNDSSILDNLITGLYSYLFTAGQAAPAEHSDFAQKSFDIETDLLSGDMAMTSNTYRHFGTASTLQATKRTSLRTYGAWRVNFKMISEANNTLKEYFGSDKNIPQRDQSIKNIFDDKTALKRIPYVQLKFLRAYAYFQLANLYAGNYEEYKDKKVLPIYNLDTGAETREFSTLKEVYEFIIADLLQAKEVMTDSEFLKAIKYGREDKLSVDASVISAFLAYSYLTIGDYEKAYAEASGYVDNANYPILKSAELTTTGFNDIKHKDLLWGVDITLDTRGNLSSFWGHMDVYTYSYAFAGMTKVINNYLFDQIPEYDLRKNWFSKDLGGCPTGKFFSNKGKIGFGADRDWLSDIHFLRTEEYYLIAAEAAARKGDDAKSKEVLIKLLKERTDGAKIAEMEGIVNAYDNAQLLEAIRYNWRVEMWGEGKGLQTMRRFKSTNKWASSSFANSDIEVPYNRIDLVYEIPDREVQNNPNASN